MVTGEEGADGLVEDFADLFEAELAVMSKFDDFSVGVVELLDCGSEGGGVDWFGVVVVVGVLDTGVLEVAGVCRSCVATASSELISDAVHGDAE